MGDQDGFGAAAVDAGCAGDGFELFEFACAEPVETGGHPLFLSLILEMDQDGRSYDKFADASKSRPKAKKLDLVATEALSIGMLSSRLPSGLEQILISPNSRLQHLHKQLAYKAP